MDNSTDNQNPKKENPPGAPAGGGKICSPDRNRTCIKSLGNFYSIH